MTAFILGMFCGALVGVAAMALLQINHIDREQRK